MVPLAWTDRGPGTADVPLTYEVLIDLAGVITAIEPRHVSGANAPGSLRHLRSVTLPRNAVSRR
jgi:hypothetical protein